jgi:hypothetical protein
MSFRTRTARVATACAVAAVPLIGAVTMTGPSASAVALPSDCPQNHWHNNAYLKLCLYWGGNELGARFEEYREFRADYAGQTFPCNGDGYGGCGEYVKNNAASAANPTEFHAYLFYNEHCSGPYDAVAPYSARNLVQTWNDEASYENPFLNDGTLGGC